MSLVCSQYIHTACTILWFGCSGAWKDADAGAQTLQLAGGPLILRPAGRLPIQDVTGDVEGAVVGRQLLHAVLLLEGCDSYEQIETEQQPALRWVQDDQRWNEWLAGPDVRWETQLQNMNVWPHNIKLPGWMRELSVRGKMRPGHGEAVTETCWQRCQFG